jgi:hypothetical protein
MLHLLVLAHALVKDVGDASSQQCRYEESSE